MRIRSSERGQVLPLVAMCLTVIMGFAAMAIDVGFIEYQQRQQQSAADAAAIAGAQALGYVGCNNQATVAQNAATADATTNGYTESTNGVPISVTINNPPATGNPYAGNDCAVQAIITNNQTQTFFMRLFGWTTGMPVTTEAVAASELNANGCAFLLGPNATPDFHGAKMNAAGCSMLINGSPTFDGGTIDFSTIGYTGSATTNGTTFTSASPAPMLPVADPCPEIAGCRELTNNPPPTSNCTMTISSSSLSPGCYSSFKANGGGSYTMAPGLYILTGSCNKCNTLGGANLTGSDVTIYVAPGAAGLDIHGITANLSACTTACGSGTYAAIPDVLYFQPPSNTNPVNLAGPQGSFSGLIYAPTADVTYNGNAGDGYTLTVFGDWKLNGTGQNMDFSPSPQNGGFLPQAVLVQ